VVAAIASALVLGAATLSASSAQAGSSALGAPVVHRAWKGSGRSGYSGSLAVQVYRLRHASAVPALPFTGRKSLGCPYNAQTDAVIPVAVTVKNTTKRFSANVTLNAQGTYPRDGGGQQAWDMINVHGDLAYGAGNSKCTEQSGRTLDLALATATWSSLAPGASGTFDFYIVLNNYFSPAHPNGDKAMMSGVGLALAFAVGSPSSQDALSDGVELKPSPAFVALLH
jgi:hypothetical protein